MAKQRTFIVAREDKDFRYHVHDSLSKAVKEAQRLASESGAGFFTFEVIPQSFSIRGAVTTRAVEAGEIEWDDDEDDE